MWFARKKYLNSVSKLNKTPVEYLALKVDEKRSDYLKPTMRELLKVYDAWLALVNHRPDSPIYPVCLLPYINLGNKVDKNVSGIFKDLIGVEE